MNWKDYESAGAAVSDCESELLVLPKRNENGGPDERFASGEEFCLQRNR